MAIVNPGFKSPLIRRPQVPPGQSVVVAWPVLTYGPTPRIDTDSWQLEIAGEVNSPVTFNWAQFNELPKAKMRADIHCVTRWSKLDMDWEGVSVDELIKRAGGLTRNGNYLIASCYGGYTTNLPIEDVIGDKALVATHAEGEPLAPAHGAPARLFVPHLYFWKSAKYINKLIFTERDHMGFWEVNGYHNYGDPWKEQRYDTDY